MNSQARSGNATAPAVGLDGYFTLLLSNVVLIATAGVYWLWLSKIVYHRGKHTPAQVHNCDVLAVLGMRPNNNQINDEYKTRLNRAVTLFEHGFANSILLIGGKTGNNTESEAELGVQYLVKRGLSAEFLLREDRSRHTLENLHNSRGLISNHKDKTAAIITSRYHLERCRRMANSLQLTHRLCAAEDEFLLDVKTLFNILKEAYFIHWYEIGKAWAYCVNSQNSLNRIR